MKFVVDTTGVAKGLRDYRSAVDGIFASLSKFEAHVEKTMKGVSKASANPQAIAAFKRAVGAFSKVDIDTSAARKLSALSAAMSGFKSPSPAQITNTRRFFSALGNLPDLSRAYKSIRALSDLNAAMSGFKSPAASHAKNLTAFANAVKTAVPALSGLSRIAGISGIANELATISIAMRNLKAPSANQVTNLGNLALALRSFNFSNLSGSGNFYAALTAIGNFRAPSPAQIRNLQQFVNAVAQMRVPPNAGAVANALNQIASAASRAGGALGGFRAGLGNLGGSLGHVGGQARGASLQMMGLQNAFSATFQAGSVLRSLLGSLTIAELGRGFFEATNAAIQFRAQMGVVNKDLQFADSQMQFVRATANAFGVDMLAAATGFAKISIAADKSGISVMQTRHIFEGMNSAMTVLGTTTAGQQDVWLALQQVMNKGYLSAEELNQQLNEKLPGAMAYATEYAKSMGMSLEDGLKKKALDAAGVLAHISKRMKEDFGPAVADALMRPSAQMNILRNNFNSLFIAIGEAGGNEAFSSLLAKINARMKPEDIERYARAIGESLKGAVDKLSAAFDWLYNNWDSIKGPLSTTLELMGRWAVISGTLQIARFIVQPLMMIPNALGGLRQTGLLIQSLIAPTAQASLALQGGFASAAVAIQSYRNSLVTSITATRAAAASNGILATSLGIVSRAGVAAAAGIRGLIGLLGGPYLLAFAAAGAAAYMLYDDFSKGNEVIRTNGKWLGEQRKKLDETKGALDRVRGITVVARNETNAHNGSVASGTAFMDAYNAKINQATGGLWDMARAARAATIENLKLQQADATKRLTDIGMQSSSALWRGAGVMWDRGQYGNSILMGARAGLMGAKSGLGFGPSQDEINAQFNAASQHRDNVTAQLAAAEGTTDKEWLAYYQKQFPNGLGGGTVAGGKPSGSGTGSGRRTPTLEEQRNKVENQVDSLMQKLAKRDPIGKLHYDFVKNLTDQAHVLLNNKGYEQFFTGMKAAAGDATAQTNALITALQSGNLSAKTMDDLKARYGEDVNGIIEMLKAQQVAYEDALKDSTIKGLEIKYKAVADAMDLLGDAIPSVREAKDNLTELTGLGRLAFPPGEGLNKWLDDLNSGAITAAEALDQLMAIMADPNKRSAGVSQFMVATGTTEQDIMAAGRGKVSGNEYRRREAELDLKFGERLLQQRYEEITLMGVSTQQAEIFTTVQEEVRRARAANVKVTNESIAALTKEVAAQQALANQMQRNKEFFENNGVRSYLNELKTAGEAINELDKTTLQSLEDQLFNLGTTGKFSFNAIFDTIQQGLVRFASQEIMKTLTTSIFGADQTNGGTPSMFAGLFKMFGAKYEPAKTDKLGTVMNPMYVAFANGASVDVNGNIFKGSGNRTVTMEGVSDPSTRGTQMNPMFVQSATGAIPGITSAAPAGTPTLEQQFDQTFGTGTTGTPTGNTGALAQTTQAAAQTTATSFKDTMVGMMPMVGMAFASQMKSPIAQIATMFGMMMLQQMMASQTAGGGGGGLLGGLLKIGTSVFGGGAGGLAAGVSKTIAANPGIFKEGGYPGSPVARGSIHPAAFVNAPHYAEGTPNTSGGMPAILHDNEAVIPLSRGRKVPVEIAGGGSRGQVINNNFVVNTPDANSFRKSKQQIATDMHMQAGRAYRRNHG